MQGRDSGLTLIELLMAIPISVCVVAVIFMLFQKCERVARDQDIVVEMQQAARVVSSQIADDIRMAGQSIPPGMNDVVLPGSDASRLNLRSGYSATETNTTSAVPLSVATGVPTTVAVEGTTGFSGGRQAFLWWEADWARVTINSVSGSAKKLQLTPTRVSRVPLTFLTAPVVSIDEAVAIYRDPATQAIKRTTATNTDNPMSPAWAPANELVTNVTGLVFSYYDISGVPLVVDSPENRSRVSTIEAQITVRASAPLSDGKRPTYSVTIRSSPRNLSLRDYFTPQ